MSEWHVEVVHVGKIEAHPNADTLGIAQVHGGYPCIVKLGEIEEGDLALYIPVDSVCPDTPLFAFLGERRRIRPLKLRGIFSMGLLLPVPEDLVVGQFPEHLAGQLGITRWEPPAAPARTGGQAAGEEDEPCPYPIPKYTDIEALRRWPHALGDGEPVVLMEKIHGANARFCFTGDRLWCGSHNQFKSPEKSTLWGKLAEQEELEVRLSTRPDLVLYGEIYGWVQDLKYGTRPGELAFRAFDAFDLTSGQFLDFEAFCNAMESLDLAIAPILYQGPWYPELTRLAEGPSKLHPGHCREGFVVRPVRERFDPQIGRVILKYHGEDYLLRKQRD